ncbi:hypothetical protein CAPTEDRAFT_228550 [Capitella teleta]|uniref:Uncharacterized protein n=1 Tax=Capitella teleta TaxID=283909 RepID=R7UAS0_CAPTE|nr:hypothetical protein CAPTEDRAFT_228550 [Capitella teleta]|eukprot:ELU00362.1 hypothetical protein CAPTEDRAFT_228550 [Capitella teleta]
MIGRADIEGSKSNVAMNAWLPQASYPCVQKGSIGPAFAVRIRTENQDQDGFCPFALREVSVLAEPSLGHLRYLLTDVPPQSNSPPDYSECGSYQSGGISPATEVSRLFYTSGASVQSQTAVKLNRVFFPRRRTQARSPGCGFAR